MKSKKSAIRVIRVCMIIIYVVTVIFLDFEPITKRRILIGLVVISAIAREIVDRFIVEDKKKSDKEGHSNTIT